MSRVRPGGGPPRDRRGALLGASAGALLALLLLTASACGGAGAIAGGSSATAGVAASPSAVATSPATEAPTPAKHSTATPRATSSSGPKLTPRSTPTPKPKPSSSTPAGHAAAAPATSIVFVDVGQGDAAIIRSGSWTGLIDGGPSGSEAAIEGALRGLGVGRLDAVVVSHPHADHTGGLSGVVSDYRPRQAYVGEGAGSAAAALHSVGARIVKVRRGETLRFGSLRASVLSPGSLSGDANVDSVVLLVEAGGKRFLFTGDCTGASEALVGSICARGPPLYLLKVAHHGSRSSTSSSFLGETRPRFAVISVGPNSYGHPTPQTIAALRAAGTRIYSTQKNGTLALTVSASGGVAWRFARSSRPVTGAGGSPGGPPGGSSGGGSGKVYITETGECYHRAGCRYLSHSKIAISLKDAKARGYRPCSVCDPPQ
jgi:competence protein ComEC